MANVIDIIVNGEDNASDEFKRIGQMAERAFKQAESALDGLEREMRNIPDIEIDADTTGAIAQIKALESRLEALERDEIEIKIQADTNFLMASILSLGPAMAPVLATTSAAIVGLGTAFATAGIGALAFGAVAVPVLQRVFDETANLTKKEREARKALDSFKSFWAGFTASFRDPILDMFIQSLGTLKTALTGLKPVFAASIAAFGELFDSLDTAIKSSQMQTFFKWLAGNVGPSIQAFGQIFGNVMTGIMNLMMAFGPVATDMQNGLVGLTQRFAEWTAGLSQSQGFQQFIGYVRANGPIIMSILGQLGTLFVNLMKAMAPFGPVVLKAVDSLLKFTNNLLTAQPAVGSFAVALGLAIGLFKLIAPPITAAISVFSRFVPYLTKAGKAITDVVKNFKNFGSLARIAGPIGIAVTALTLLYNKSKEFASFVSTTFKGVSDGLSNTFSSLSSSIEPLKTALSTMGTAFSNLWTAIQPIALGIGVVLVMALTVAISLFNGLISAIAPLAGVIVNVITLIVSLASAFMSLLTLDFSGMFESLNAAVEAFVSILMGVVDTVVAFFTGMWAMLVAVFAAFGVNLNAAALAVFTALYNLIVTIATSIWTFLTMIWNQVLSNAVAIWNAMRAAGTAVWNALKAAAVAIFNGIKSAITTAVNATAAALSAAWSRIRSAATSAWNSIRSTASSAWNSIKSTVTSAMNAVANAVRNGFNRAKSAVSSAASSIRSILSSLASSAFSWGSNLGSMFASGISSAISRAVAAARNAAAQIASYLGFSSPTEKGPGRTADKWAPNLMSMYADGIQSGIPQLKAASINAAGTLGSGLNPSIPTAASTSSSNTTYNYTINNYNTQQASDKATINALRRAGWLYG